MGQFCNICHVFSVETKYCRLHFWPVSKNIFSDRCKTCHFWKEFKYKTHFCDTMHLEGLFTKTYFEFYIFCVQKSLCLLLYYLLLSRRWKITKTMNLYTFQETIETSLKQGHFSQSKHVLWNNQRKFPGTKPFLLKLLTKEEKLAFDLDLHFSH